MPIKVSKATLEKLKKQSPSVNLDHFIEAEASSNKPKTPAKPGSPSKDEAPPPQPKGTLVPFIDKLSVTITIPEADYAAIHSAVWSTIINDKETFQSAKRRGRRRRTKLISTIWVSPRGPAMSKSTPRLAKTAKIG